MNPASSEDYDLSFKIQLIGDSGVGKSSLLVRFVEGEFLADIAPTIGVDFRVKYVEMNNKTIKLMIWDTAGQERFRTLTSAYYRGAHGIILVYDITDRNSFDHLMDVWMGEVESYKSFPDVVKLLVGNKKDLVSEDTPRAVPQSLAEEFAKTHGMMWIEASAKTEEGVAQTFTELVSKILDTDSLVSVASGSRKVGVNLNNSEPKSSAGGGLCC
eukprot:TRINITY_DN517_c2_g1_i1.p1 TRINITY_DN517_c2_g1~~TRINITY_DN517_c2_g1_i1.p1  ORF type:complete len:214 (+),score=32.72 TRINITY_DN517_c2_g1_i1:53-694(+)